MARTTTRCPRRPNGKVPVVKAKSAQRSAEHNSGANEQLTQSCQRGEQTPPFDPTLTLSCGSSQGTMQSTVVPSLPLAGWWDLSNVGFARRIEVRTM